MKLCETAVNIEAPYLRPQLV